MKEKQSSNKISELVNKINDDPDLLHMDYTPAVHELSTCGIDALKAVLPLLNSEEIWERYRAQRVLEGVIQRMYGWQPGKGYPKESDGEKEVENLLLQMGNYQANSPSEIRKVSISKWEEWLEDKLKNNE